MSASKAGITLVELVLASSIMGILFLSGLHYIGSVIALQARMAQPTESYSLAQLKTETRLRLLLSDAQQVAISPNHQKLSFVKHDTQDTIAFRQTHTQWQLWHDQELFAQGPSVGTTSIGFEQAEPNLIKVKLSTRPYWIWLRNVAP